MDDFAQKLIKLNEETELASRILSGKDQSDIQEILQIHFELEFPADLVHLDLQANQIVEILSQYNEIDHANCGDRGHIEIEDIDYELQLLEEQTTKQKNSIWRVHKNDADPWPSSWHAHNYQSGQVLDLKTGNIYSKNRKLIKKLKKKKLKKLKDNLK
jgi:hypothetical protein